MLLLGLSQMPAPPANAPTPGTAFCNMNLIDFHEGPQGDFIHTPSGMPCDPNFIGSTVEYVIEQPVLPKATIQKFLIFGGLIAAAGFLWWLSTDKQIAKSQRRRARTNPAEDPEDFYEDFHWGKPPNKNKRVSTSKRPKTLVQLGTVESVIYRSNKNDGEHDYIHDFEGERPVLAMDADNRRLHFVGGDYDVEAAGIVG